MKRVLEASRRAGFHTLDLLRNLTSFSHSATKALLDLRRLGSLSMGHPEVQAHVDAALEQVLSHASQSVPAYAHLADSPTLVEFPVVNKSTITAEWSSHLSRAKGFRRARTVRTSGSTGAPFEVAQDRRKAARVKAEVVYFHERVGYRLGAPIATLRPKAAGVAQSNAMREFATNNRLLLVDQIGNERRKELLAEVTDFTDHPRSVFVGVTNGLEELTKNAVETNMRWPLPVVSSGEVLLQRVREDLRRVFRGPVVSRYSDKEMGVLAQDDMDADFFSLNHTNYFFEILQFGSDEPAVEGKSGRIVVTDLYNYAMPLIRYDTGDIGAFEQRELGGALHKGIVSLAGRQIDTLTDVKGRYVMPNALVNTLLEEHRAMEQLQIVQSSDGGYVIRVSASGDLDERRIVSRVKETLGADASVRIEQVNAIPVLASGKRRVVVNEQMV